MESGLQRFQRGAASRPDGDKIREVVAAATGAPHRVLIGAGHLPGHIVAAGSLFRADRRPATKLAGRNSRTAVSQSLHNALPISIKIENVANLDQAGRSK